MKINTSFYYSDTFKVPMPEGHRFPMDKYKLLREKLLADQTLKETELIESTPINDDHLELAHDQKYINEVLNLTLDQKKAKRIGLPLTKEMILRAKASVGGSFLASQKAMEVGISGALSSGTHHALYDNGEGFCFFNDFAIIARNNLDKKILIIDLDVHQGNGNGAILKNDEHVTIIDIYCKNNYPLKKQSSPYGETIGLPAGIEDKEYLNILDIALSKINSQFDLILYQAGVDILEGDLFGKMNISLDGITKRDQIVFEFAKKYSKAISFVIGGGYSQNILKTVAANAQTFKMAKEVYNF